MQNSPSSSARARPVFTRSSLVLQVAEQLASDDQWPFQQASVHLRPQGGEVEGITLFGSDSPDAISQVARGEVQFAITNPAAAVTLAVRGTGPFKEPIPIRAIAVIPSGDWYAFAISERTGLTSLAEIRERRYPLRISVRGQRDHGTHLLEHEVLRVLGFSFEDIVAWGGQVRYDPGLPHGMATSGADLRTSRLDLAARGDIDAIFDEGVKNWVEKAVGLGMRIIGLEPSLIETLERMGFRGSVLPRARFPGLPSDVPTLDFSGWPLFTLDTTSDAVVTAFCAALEARKERIAWPGDGPLPLDRMCKDSPETPLDILLHPAAERFWRAQGYL